MIALGLVAAALLERGRADPAELLAAGSSSRATRDNLAAALAGGVCLSWGTQLVRIADRPPAVPVALIPETTVSTAASRAALPATVTHADAAFTAGRATLLGAALAAGSTELFSEALTRPPARALPGGKRAAARRGAGGPPSRRPRRDALRLRAGGDRLGP